MPTPFTPPEDSGLEPVDLAALAASGIARPKASLVAVGPRSDKRFLLYPARVHWLTGEPGAGKTWIALMMACWVLWAGGRVILLDYEDCASMAVDRLMALGVEPADLARVLYLPVDGALTPSSLAWLPSLIADHAIALVILDSIGVALAAERLDEDRAPPVNTFASSHLRPWARAGAAVLCLDHVVKATEDRGHWARGSGAKLAVVDGAAFTFTLTESFSQDRSGRGDLGVAKDRPGAVGAKGQVVAKVGFEVAGGSISEVIFDAPGHGGPPPEVEYADVADALRASGGTWSSRAEAATALDISSNAVGAALAGAVRAGVIIEEPVGARGRRYSLPDEPVDAEDFDDAIRLLRDDQR